MKTFALLIFIKKIASNNYKSLYKNMTIEINLFEVLKIKSEIIHNQILRLWQIQDIQDENNWKIFVVLIFQFSDFC